MKKFCVFIAVVMALVATFAVSSSAFEAELYSAESVIVTYEVANNGTAGTNNPEEDGTGGLVTGDDYDKEKDLPIGGGDNNNNDDNTNDDTNNDTDGNTNNNDDNADDTNGDSTNKNENNDNTNNNGDGANIGGGTNPTGGGTGNNGNDNNTEPQKIDEPEIDYGKFVLSIPSTITVGETVWVSADIRFPAERVFTVSVGGFETDGTIRLYNTNGSGEYVSILLQSNSGMQYSNNYNMLGQWFYYDRGLCVNFTPVLASDTTKVSNGTYSGTIQFNVSTYVMG